MRISILDPGLAGLQGHHFDLDLRLFRALLRRGHDVTVHGSAKPRPDLIAAIDAAGMRFAPTFHVGAYPAPPETVAPMEGYRILARATAADLAALPSADLWFWPTLVPHQFLAAVEQPRGIPQLGGIWFLPRIWAHAAELVAEAKVQPSMLVGAYDDLLCQAYRTAWPALPSVVTLPCPHDGAPNERRPTGMRRIGFFGHQRPSRGRDLLPQLVMDLIGRGYEVVVQDSGRSIFREGNDPRLTVLPFVPDVPAEMAQCDLVIWPSRKEAYQQSLSGIVSECIATGVPVILPSGCVPAKVAARFDAGVSFSELSREAILEAVDKVQRTYPAVAVRAGLAAAKWHAENGTGRLVDWIMERFGGLS